MNKYCKPILQKDTQPPLVKEWNMSEVPDKYFFQCTVCDMGFGYPRTKLSNYVLARTFTTKHVISNHAKKCYKCKHCNSLYARKRDAMETECNHIKKERD